MSFSKPHSPLYEWSDLCQGKNLPDYVLFSGLRTTQVLLARSEDQPFPAFIIKDQVHRFRTRLSQDLPVSILLSIDAVPPALTAHLHVLSVIFDDPTDPYFRSHHLYMFSIDHSLGWVRHYDPYLARDILTLLNQPDKGTFCGLLVVDESNRVLLAKFVHFSPKEQTHHQNLFAIMKLLPPVFHSMPLAVWSSSIELHEQTFVKTVVNPHGKTLNIPRFRDPAKSQLTTFPLYLVNNKVSLQERPSPIPWEHRRYDIFVSHAHIDSPLSVSIEEWLSMTFPDLVIFKTDPTSEDPRTEQPFFFIEEIPNSRCVLFLATPNSLGRPMVMAELGAALHSNVLTLMVGGVTTADLLSFREKHIFVGYEVDKAFDMASPAVWVKIETFLGELFQISKKASITPPKVVCEAKIQPQHPNHLVKDFSKEYLRFLEYFSRKSQAGHIIPHGL